MDTTRQAAFARPLGSPAEVAAGLGQLARWAFRLSFEAIPGAIQRRALLVLCDDLAAIVAARAEPEIVRLQEQMSAKPGVLEATIFRGGRIRADRYSAAVANAAAADWCELDEGYRRATCHAGLYTVPSLLAEAEAAGASAAELVRALVIGYEVAGRFARAFAFKSLVLHPHGCFAAVGASAAVAALRRVPEDQFVAAVAAASTLVAPGPFNHAVRGALVRNVWPAAGAWCGMRAVDWAACGIGGLAESPYYVFVDAFGADCHPGELTSGLGSEWAIADGYHKIHACCQYSHSAVEAALELLGQMKRRPNAGEIERVTVEAHRLGMSLDNRKPATTLAAKFSLPHIVAATCVLGHAGAEAFASSTLADPVIAGLRDRVELKPLERELPPPNDRGARVTLWLKDATPRTAECLSARGGPDRPFAAAEIEQKIARITESVYPAFPGVAKRLIAAEAALLRRGWADIVTEITGMEPS